MMPYESPWYFIFAVVAFATCVWASPKYNCAYEPAPDSEDIRTCAPARDQDECMGRLGHQRICRKVENK